MEKVLLTHAQALEEYQKNADGIAGPLKVACEKFSSFVSQISESTDGRMLPNLSFAAISALADAIDFIDQISSGKETLTSPPKKVEVPAQYKAYPTENSVSIKVPNFEDQEIFAEWINSELMQSLSTLWGAGKTRVNIRGVAVEGEDKLDHIEFKHLNSSEILKVYSGMNLEFGFVYSDQWMKIVAE